jgi:nucleoside-triphosphatase
MNILITGVPGIGKTTLIKKVVEDLSPLPPIGFYTQEVRQAGRRIGFELIGFDGRRTLLSHVDIKSRYRVGKYGVALEDFESFLAPLLKTPPDKSLTIIDEIGKMECFSAVFQSWIRNLLDSPNPVLATIALRGGGFIAECRTRQDVFLIQTTQANRNTLPQKILEQISSLFV